MNQGAKYMQENFPQTDRFRSCRVERRIHQNNDSKALESDAAPGMTGQLRHHAVPYDDHNRTDPVFGNPTSIAFVLFLGSMFALWAQYRWQKQRKAGEKHSA